MAGSAAKLQMFWAAKGLAGRWREGESHSCLRHVTNLAKYLVASPAENAGPCVGPQCHYIDTIRSLCPLPDASLSWLGKEVRSLRCGVQYGGHQNYYDPLFNAAL